MILICIVGLLAWGEYRRYEYFHKLSKAMENKAEAETQKVKGVTP